MRGTGQSSNDAGFLRIHCYARGGDDESEVFNGVCVEGGFVETGVKNVISGGVGGRSDMFRVIYWVVRKDEDVVQVYDDRRRRTGPGRYRS